MGELYQLHSIFAEQPGAGRYGFRTHILDTANAAVEALSRGGPFSVENLAAAGSQYGGTPPDLDEQELLRFLLESKVQLLANEIGAAISTSYDSALARLNQDTFGAVPY